VNTNFTVLFRIIGQKFVYSQYSQPCLMWPFKWTLK
jgi:hypothetical protein